MNDMSEDDKQVNLDEVRRLLKKSEIENKREEERKNNIPDFLRQIKKGVLTFAILHLLFEICMSLVSNNFTSLWQSVFVNYFVSTWYAKEKLTKNKLSVNTHYFNYGVKVSFIVFLIRLVLGVIFSILINYRLNNL